MICRLLLLQVGKLDELFRYGILWGSCAHIVFAAWLHAIFVRRREALTLQHMLLCEWFRRHVHHTTVADLVGCIFVGEHIRMMLYAVFAFCSFRIQLLNCLIDQIIIQLIEQVVHECNRSGNQGLTFPNIFFETLRCRSSRLPSPFLFVNYKYCPSSCSPSMRKYVVPEAVVSMEYEIAARPYNLLDLDNMLD